MIEACRQPGVSVAAVALANNLNANLLRKQVNDAERMDRREPAGRVELTRCAQAEPTTGFVPLQVPASNVPPEIRIEVKRAGTSRQPDTGSPACCSLTRSSIRAIDRQGDCSLLARGESGKRIFDRPETFDPLTPRRRISHEWPGRRHKVDRHRRYP